MTHVVGGSPPPRTERRLTPTQQITAYGYAVGGLFTMVSGFDTRLYRRDGLALVLVAGLLLIGLGAAVFVWRRETPMQTLVQTTTSIGVAVACASYMRSPIMATATAAALGMLTMGVAARCTTWQTCVVMGLTSVAGVGLVARTGAGGIELGGVGAMVVGLCVAPAITTLRYRRQVEESLDRVRVMATTDPLTGLTNRRGMEDLLPLLVGQAVRDDQHIGVLMIDIDHFKQFNDTHGHLAGDEAIRAVADIVRGTARQNDIVARFGGEEFCLVAALGRVEDLESLGERMRKEVEAAAACQVTVSLGGYLSLADPEVPAGRFVWSMVAVADEQLYAAKEAGRNVTRVRAAREG